MFFLHLYSGDGLFNLLEFLCESDFFMLENKKKVLRCQIWRIRWMQQQFIIRFNQFRRGEGNNIAGVLSWWKDSCSPSGAVFSSIQIDSIIRHSTALWPFCPSPDNRFEKTVTFWSMIFHLVPCFIDYHETSFNNVKSALKWPRNCACCPELSKAANKKKTVNKSAIMPIVSACENTRY